MSDNRQKTIGELETLTRASIEQAKALCGGNRKRLDTLEEIFVAYGKVKDQFLGLSCILNGMRFKELPSLMADIDRWGDRLDAIRAIMGQEEMTIN